MHNQLRGNVAGTVALVALSREQPRRTIASALARAGWQVSLATTGPETFEVALRERPELIVVDRNLGLIADGLHVAQAIADYDHRSWRPRLVLVSSRQDEDTTSLAKAARVARVVIVPDGDASGGPGEAVERRNRVVVAEPEPPKQERSLWIVDDNRAVRLLVRHAFEREGWVVREFENLASAQEAARLAATAARERPHAVVLDIHLPDGNGLDNVRRFAATGAAVVVVSNLAGPEQVERAFGAGAADLISKPFDPRNLVARVHRAVTATPPSVVSRDVIPTEAPPLSERAPSVVMTHWG